MSDEKYHARFPLLKYGNEENRNRWISITPKGEIVYEDYAPLDHQDTESVICVNLGKWDEKDAPPGLRPIAALVGEQNVTMFDCPLDDEDISCGRNKVY